MKKFFRSVFFRFWYWYVSTVDKNAQVIFMNYGYEYDDKKIELEPRDELNRYSVQIYHYIASSVEIKDKDIVEVGCGRGGGLSFVKRYFKPKTHAGLDLEKQAIHFCKRHYKEEGGHFYQGTAQKLPFQDSSFDVLLNVESSHRYPQMPIFLSEVKRVLRPNGYFLMIDFRYVKDVEKMDKDIADSGMELISKTDVTPNVVKALRLATPARLKLINDIAPKFLHDLSKNFAATEGSEIFRKFAEREYQYYFYLLRKK
jgi:ubiquinone/menaquinone biosynthesis C-methylase UbiE